MLNLNALPDYDSLSYGDRATYNLVRLAAGGDPATAMLMKKGRGNKRQTQDALRDLRVACTVQATMRARSVTHGEAAEIVHMTGMFTKPSEHAGGAKPLSASRILNIYLATFPPK